MWDAATGKELWRALPRQYSFEPQGAAYGMRAVAFSSDDSRFYTPGQLDQVLVWETSSGRHEVLTVKLPNRNDMSRARIIRSVDVTPDGTKLAVGNANGVFVCNIKGEVLYAIANAPTEPELLDNKDRLTISGHYSLGRFSPNGKMLAVAKSDSPEEVRLCDAETGRVLRKVALTSRLVRLAFSWDGKQLATTVLSGDGTCA